MTKLIALLVSLLLTFFPDSAFLECKAQELAFPGTDKVCEMIAKYIKKNDVDSIYDLFCEADKLDHENLKEQIQDIIEIVDGKTVKIERKLGVGHQSDYANMGVYQSKRDFALQIDTIDGSYELLIFWITVDTELPENVGLGSLALFDSEINLVAEAY